jgi:O-antigen/teichoic acid export membrane protein
LLSRPYALLSRGRDYVRGEGLGPLLVRSVGGSAAVRLGSMAASFAVGVQLARMLGVTGYGYYGLALSIITIASIPGELGVPLLVTREVAASSTSGDPARLFGVLRWATQVAGTMSLIAALLLVAAGFVLIEIRPTLGACLVLGAPIVPFMIFARIEGGALQGLQHVIRGQIPANLLRPVFLSVGIFVVYLFGPRLGAPAATSIRPVAAALSFLVAYAWLLPRLPRKEKVATIQDGRRWLASTIPMATTDGIRVLQTELTVVLLGLVVAPADVGYYRIATATAVMAAFASQAVAQVAIPIIPQLYAERDRPRLQNAVTAFAWAQLMGVLLLSLPLLLFPGQLIKFVFGASYLPAATPLRILVFGQLASAAFGPNTILLNMTHEERRLTRAVSIASGIGLVLVAILSVIAGATGAAVATVIWMLIWNLLTWADAKRFLGIETSVIRFPRISGHTPV